MLNLAEDTDMLMKQETTQYTKGKKKNGKNRTENNRQLRYSQKCVK